MSRARLTSLIVVLGLLGLYWRQFLASPSLASTHFTFRIKDGSMFINQPLVHHVPLGSLAWVRYAPVIRDRFPITVDANDRQSFGIGSSPDKVVQTTQAPGAVPSERDDKVRSGASSTPQSSVSWSIDEATCAVKSKYQVSVTGVVAPSIDLAHDPTSKSLITMGREYVLNNCSVRPTFLVVSLYTPQYLDGKQVASEGLLDFRTGDWRDYYNNTRGGEQRRKISEKIELLNVKEDPETGVRLSYFWEWILDRTGPPRLCQGVWIPIVGEVPSRLDLTDDTHAMAIINKAKQYAFGMCPRLEKDNLSIWISLYREDFDPSKWIGPGMFSLQSAPVFAKFHAYETTRYTKPSEYKNQIRTEFVRQKEIAEQKEAESRKQEVARRRAEEYAQKKIISRSIEGFTLGMSLQQARQIVDKRIKEGQFSILLMDPNVFAEHHRMVCVEAYNCARIPIIVARFKTEATYVTELVFYNGKLFSIQIDPLAKGELMEKALWEKYGDPIQREYFLGGGVELNQQWMDAKTRLFFGKSPGTILRFSDIELESAMQSHASRLLSEAEAERRQREKTLPKGF